MATEETTHSWTLGGLIGAFIDLVIAYFLLCGSAFAFFGSKLFSFFRLCLPCPCKGSFGFRNSSFCVHKVLFEWPSRKICSIQVMAAKRFPFDLIRVKGHSGSANDDKVIAERTHGNRVVDLEDEASCSSCSGPPLVPFVDRENVYDAKGKRVMSMKRRSGVRRRRRASYDCGKIPPVVPCDNLQSDDVLTSCLPCDGSIIRDKTNEIIKFGSGKEVSALGIDDAQTGHDLDEKTFHSYEFNESMVDSPGQDKCSSSLEKHGSNAQNNVTIVGNEEDRIKMLENALGEEKAAYAALYLELEKERAAAATAADEAMAMILRLQEEKASMEMEMRQYQRMIDERVAYDEEEMNILQEILIRRERENHFLEKELEAYRQTDLKGSDQSFDKPTVQLDEWEQSPSISIETFEDRSTISIAKKDEMSDISSNYMVTQTRISTEDREEQEKNTGLKDQVHDNLHSSFYDTEPDVLDVHVINDNIELREEENEKLSSSSMSTVINEPTNRSLEFGSLAVQNSKVRSNCPRAGKTENVNSVDDGLSSQLSMFSSSRRRSLPFDYGSDSSCAVHYEFGSLAVQSSKVQSNCPRAGKTENGNSVDDGSSSQLSMFPSSRCRSLPFDYGSDSSCAVHYEKLKISNEIEILGERLRMLKQEKEKLTFFPENGEGEKRQLKLLEEIANHLQRIKQLRNPVRRASLPPSSSKVSLRKRRCQSATLGTCESS